jgi:hypothetical protein
VSTFALSWRIGDDVEQIDKTYGHLLPDAAEHERGLMDAWDARPGEQEEANVDVLGAERAQSPETRATSAYAKTSVFPATSS